MGAGHDVEAELARLKGELSQGSAPREIEGTANGSGAAAAAGTGSAAIDSQAAPAAQPAQPAEQPQAGDGT